MDKTRGLEGLIIRGIAGSQRSEATIILKYSYPK